MPLFTEGLGRQLVKFWMDRRLTRLQGDSKSKDNKAGDPCLANIGIHSLCVTREGVTKCRGGRTSVDSGDSLSSLWERIFRGLGQETLSISIRVFRSNGNGKKN